MVWLGEGVRAETGEGPILVLPEKDEPRAFAAARPSVGP